MSNLLQAIKTIAEDAIIKVKGYYTYLLPEKHCGDAQLNKKNDKILEKC